MSTLLLLLASNVFMTLAWYGHLRFKNVPLWQAILVSWGIAFFEYCLQVPANRLGYFGKFSAMQLKILQEVLSIGVLWFSRCWRWAKPRAGTMASRSRCSSPRRGSLSCPRARASANAAYATRKSLNERRCGGCRFRSAAV